MKLTKIIYASLAILATLPSCTPQAARTQQHTSTTQQSTAYKLFKPSLTTGNTNYNGYINSRKKLHTWLIENRSANRELAKFLVSADLKTQEIYLYEYKHLGSNQDRPASRVVQDRKALTLELFDQNTSPIRTKNLRRTSHFAAIIIDKNKINKINVTNKMKTTQKR